MQNTALSTFLTPIADPGSRAEPMTETNVETDIVGAFTAFMYESSPKIAASAPAEILGKLGRVDQVPALEGLAVGEPVMAEDMVWMQSHDGIALPNLLDNTPPEVSNNRVFQKESLTSISGDAAQSFLHTAGVEPAITGRSQTGAPNLEFMNAPVREHPADSVGFSQQVVVPRPIMSTASPSVLMQKGNAPDTKMNAASLIIERAPFNPSSGALGQPAIGAGGSELGIGNKDASKTNPNVAVPNQMISPVGAPVERVGTTFGVPNLEKYTGGITEKRSSVQKPVAGKDSLLLGKTTLAQPDLANTMPAKSGIINNAAEGALPDQPNSDRSLGLQNRAPIAPHVSSEPIKSPKSILDVRIKDSVGQEALSHSRASAALSQMVPMLPIAIDDPMARHEPALARHIATQIAEIVHPLPSRPVELILNPGELGRIRLTFLSENGTLNVVIAADRPETLDLMRRHIDALAQELRTAGYRDVNLGFNQGHENSGASTSERPRNSEAWPGHGEGASPEDVINDPTEGLPDPQYLGASEQGVDLLM